MIATAGVRASRFHAAIAEADVELLCATNWDRVGGWGAGTYCAYHNDLLDKDSPSSLVSRRER
jgi:hypothetical protein